MITSRMEGILSLHCLVPYKMAKGGGYEQATEVILKEFTHETDHIAFDLEQLFRISLNEANKSNKREKEPEAPEGFEDIKARMDAYENDDSPSEDEINFQATILEVNITKTKAVMVSELEDIWDGIFDAGLVELEGGGQKMIKSIWKSIDRNDRKRIMFGYISFFVKPLYSLEKMYSKMVKSNGKEATGANVALQG